MLISENRYVLLLTENYAALDVLKNPRNYLNDDASIIDEPHIIFGSNFPKDSEYSQVLFFN